MWNGCLAAETRTCISWGPLLFSWVKLPFTFRSVVFVCFFVELWVSFLVLLIIACLLVHFVFMYFPSIWSICHFGMVTVAIIATWLSFTSFWTLCFLLYYDTHHMMILGSSCNWSSMLTPLVIMSVHHLFVSFALAISFVLLCEFGAILCVPLCTVRPYKLFGKLWRYGWLYFWCCLFFRAQRSPRTSFSIWASFYV